MYTTDSKTTTNYIIEAQVTTSIEQGFRLKVSVLDLGLYIDGWRLTPPRGDKDWWLQPPARLHGRQWKPVVEFDHSKAFWQEIRAACIAAVQQWDSTEQVAEEDLSQETIEEKLDTAVRQYGLDESSVSATDKAVSWLHD